MNCPSCGRPSASPPEEIFCVQCATEGYEADALAHVASHVRAISETLLDDFRAALGYEVRQIGLVVQIEVGGERLNVMTSWPSGPEHLKATGDLLTEAGQAARLAS